MSNSAQQCLDSLFVKLQSRGWLVVFETVVVMDIVWIGGSAPKPAGWVWELRIESQLCSRSQSYADRSTFLREADAASASIWSCLVCTPDLGGVGGPEGMRAGWCKFRSVGWGWLKSLACGGSLRVASQSRSRNEAVQEFVCSSESHFPPAVARRGAASSINDLLNSHGGALRSLPPSSRPHSAWQLNRADTSLSIVAGCVGVESDKLFDGRSQAFL